MRIAVAAILTTFGLLAAARVTTGQTSMLDRVIRPDHLGAPVVWLPSSIDDGLFARRLSQGAQVPVIFEPAAVVGVGGLQTRLDLDGSTVHAALDELVAHDSRYEWRVIGNAIVIRPLGAWTDDKHPLHRPANPESPGEQPLSYALRQVVGDLDERPDVLALAVRVDRGRRVRARAGSRTTLVRLAELAGEGELFVRVTNPDAQQVRALEISTWDGQGYTVSGPRRSAQPEEAAR